MAVQTSALSSRETEGQPVTSNNYVVLNDSGANDPSAAVTAAATPSVADTVRGWGVTDTIAANQWHLPKLGNMGKIWADYTGRGVSVGVYDSGVDTRVAELAANYDASKEVVVDGKKYDGSWRPVAGGHGTSVAGLIAAARDGQGAVGVAYDSKITGVNIFDPAADGGMNGGIFINSTDPTKFLKAVGEMSNFDITNNSWGPGSLSLAAAVNRSMPGTYASAFIEELSDAVAAGRNGLGTIALKAAGNYGLTRNQQQFPFSVDGNADMIGNDRHWLTIGAYRQADGNASAYSARGAQMLISAPSDDYTQLGGTGIWTTDAKGYDGYNTTTAPGDALDYTDSFGGTSAATPITSGVVALMLDANEGLGWRDVKNILAASAKLPVAFETGKTGVTYQGTYFSFNEDRFRVLGDGAASTVNGGGYHYSTDYGYGAVDAYSAVRMAEVWSLFGKAQTSANEISMSTTAVVNAAIRPSTFVGGTTTAWNLDYTTFKVNVTSDMDIEHLDLTYAFTNTTPGQTVNFSRLWQIKVTSPDGTTYDINMNSSPVSYGLAANGPATMVVSLAGLRGETSKGEWTLSFAYLSSYETARIDNVKFDFFGTARTANDVYHYTDEFFTMAAVAGEGSRTTLSDVNGGIDWVDMAAVSSDVSLSLAEGGSTAIGGRGAFTVAAGSTIENAVTGDGNDTLMGNAVANDLYGMRGDDMLFGYAGDDRLFGGVGNDQLFGGAGNDLLDGGTGSDFMNGGAGDDIYVVDNAGDQITEFGGGGIDTVRSSVSYVLGTDLERLVLTGTASINATGNDGANYIEGNAGRNNLSGGAGNDTIVTLTGAISIKPDAGFDRVDGGAGTDTLTLGGFQSDYRLLNSGGRTFLVTARGATEVAGIEQAGFTGTATRSWATVLSTTTAFDATSYIAGYSDLRAAFGTNAAAGAQHFIDSGFAEGRSLTFNALDYVASYADLRTAIGANVTAGATHFIQWGAAENRSTTFNGWAYLASYADLIRAFGSDEAAAARHFIQWGAGEGRTTSFNALAYGAAYADLTAAFGTDAEALARHYVQYGFAEGRSPTGTPAAPAAPTTVAASAFVDNTAPGHNAIADHAAVGVDAVTYGPVGDLVAYPAWDQSGLSAAAASHFAIA